MQLGLDMLLRGRSRISFLLRRLYTSVHVIHVEYARLTQDVSRIGWEVLDQRHTCAR